MPLTRLPPPCPPQVRDLAAEPLAALLRLSPEHLQQLRFLVETGRQVRHGAAAGG
jgi:hypothetical protein